MTKLAESISKRLEERLAIPFEGKAVIAEKLQEILKEVFSIQIRGQAYHWNLRGSSFLEIHGAFSYVYKEMSYTLDRVAERIETLGSKAYLDLIGIVQSEELKPIDSRDSRAMIYDLQDAHQKLADSMREVVKVCETYSDIASANMLSQYIENNETQCWKLKSYLENGTIDNDTNANVEKIAASGY